MSVGRGRGIVRESIELETIDSGLESALAQFRRKLESEHKRLVDEGRRLALWEVRLGDRNRLLALREEEIRAQTEELKEREEVVNKIWIIIALLAILFYFK